MKKYRRTALKSAASLLTLAAFSLSGATAQETEDCATRSNNTQEKLIECVTLEGVRAHQAVFQAVADANTGNRAAGTEGYFDTVTYVADTMEAAGYDVTVQPFNFNGYVQNGPSTLAQISPLPTTYTEGSDYRLATYSGSGMATAVGVPVDVQLGLGNVSTSGCEASDFAGFPAGSIAILQRGACTFNLKATNAEAAGAVGVIIFNQGNTPEREVLLFGTLGADYTGSLPVLMTTYSLGEQFALTPGLVLTMTTDAIRGTITSYNVIADSPDGDPANIIMAGAHLDSVEAGPGINDNGSGSAALLETAIQMRKSKPRNKVRFAWWGAEEEGLIGSDHYVFNLSPEERDAIALYLNFDMIGSPNFGRFVLDGDGSLSGFGGAQGATEIEEFYNSFYDSRGLPYEETFTTFNTDTAAFYDVGIPFGGVFTGAGNIKTAGQAALYGGVAGEQFDPCYHIACDTFDNVSLEALDQNADAVAASILHFAQQKNKIKRSKSKNKVDSGELREPAVK